jgi:hypothetical protein
LGRVGLSWWFVEVVELSICRFVGIRSRQARTIQASRTSRAHRHQVLSKAKQYKGKESREEDRDASREESKDRSSQDETRRVGTVRYDETDETRPISRVACWEDVILPQPDPREMSLYSHSSDGRSVGLGLGLGTVHGYSSIRRVMQTRYAREVSVCSIRRTRSNNGAPIA